VITFERSAYVVESCVELGDVDAGVIERTVAVCEQPMNRLDGCRVRVARLLEQRGDLEQVSAHGSGASGAAHPPGEGAAAAGSEQPRELALGAAFAPPLSEPVDAFDRAGVACLSPRVRAAGVFVRGWDPPLRSASGRGVANDLSNSVRAGGDSAPANR